MELLKVDSLDETIKKLKDEFIKNGAAIKSEVIAVSESFDRVLTSDIKSETMVPDFDRSTVDGYAVMSSDTNGASETTPSFLETVGESKMGKNCDIELKSGECVYVPTGAMMPKGSDSMVMVEFTEQIGKNRIAIYESVGYGKHVVKIGDDTKKGDIVLKAGTKITGGEMGLLSSLGIKKVSVYKKWNVTIISTGDELLLADEKDSFGMIRDINTNLIAGLCAKNNFNVVNKYLIKDDDKELEKLVVDSMADSDVVVISGGSSKGKKDATSIVIDRVTSSKVLTHGIAVKPGKPTITSYDSKTNTFVIGLPGHPVASAFLFNFIIAHMYKILTGQKDIKKTCLCTVVENIPSSPGRMTFQLVIVDEEYNAVPIFARSGIINSYVKANGYIILDNNNEGINKGEKVKVYYM